MGFGFCLFVGCLGRLLFCVWLSSLVNPVTGKLSLPWLGLDSQDCHCRYDERSMVQKKNARAPLERPPLVFSRRIPCWLGAYFSSPFLMTFIPPIHPRIFSFTSCALRHLLVLLHLLPGWASLHPGEELLRGS